MMTLTLGTPLQRRGTVGPAFASSDRREVFALIVILI